MASEEKNLLLQPRVESAGNSGITSHEGNQIGASRSARKVAVVSTYIQGVHKELENMKHRILLLQQTLVSDYKECLKGGRFYTDAKLMHVKNEDMSDAQCNRQKLQSQVSDIVQNCYYVKDVIANVRSHVCDKSEETGILEEMIDKFMLWKNTLDFNFDKCMESSIRVKCINIECQEFKDQLFRQKNLLDQLAVAFTMEKSSSPDKEKLLKICKQMQKMLGDMIIFQLQRLDFCENFLYNVINMKTEKDGKPKGNFIFDANIYNNIKKEI